MGEAGVGDEQPQTLEEALANPLPRMVAYIQRQLHRNFDWVHCNAGREGSGKSTFAIQLCQMVDPGFSYTHIAFSSQQFQSMLLSLPQYSAVLFDEGSEGFYSRDAMNRFNKELMKQMMLIRGRNLFIVINIPDFTVLDKGLRTRRVLSLTETIVFTHPVTQDWVRGLYEFYTGDVLEKYYRDEFGHIYRPEPTYTGAFESLEGTPIWASYSKLKNEYYEKKLKLSKRVAEKEIEKMVS